MAKNDKFARWGDTRLKWERKADGAKISRNSEGVHDDQAVYVRNHGLIGFTLTVSEAREVAAAIIAAADEFELILAEPDVIEPSIREQVEALPVGSTFRVHFEEGSAEYLRQKSGLTLYRATYNDEDVVDETPHDMDVDLPAWRSALTLEILHLAD